MNITEAIKKKIENKYGKLNHTNNSSINGATFGYNLSIEELEKRDNIIKKLANTLKALPVSLSKECEDFLKELDDYYKLNNL